MNRDHHDALIEQLLRETLGGDRPRDLTPRVMARVNTFDRARRTWWISAGAAMAAALVLSFSLYLLWPQKYPSPVFSDGIVTAEGEVGAQPGVDRGIDFVSSAASGKVQLGGYVTATVAPDTRFALAGGPRREVVILKKGRMEFEVTKKRGTFDVRVGPAIVHVTGTTFGVEVVDEIVNGISESDDAFQKSIRVSVKEGSVNVTGVGPALTVTPANTPQVFKIPANRVRPRLVEPARPEPVTTAPEPGIVGGPATGPVAANVPEGRRGPNAGEQGTRRGAAIRGAIAAAAARGDQPAATAARPPEEAKFAPVFVVGGRGPFHFEGTLQRFDAYLILITDRGYLQMGTLQELRAMLREQGIDPGQQTHVQIEFGNGRVQSIRKAPPTTRGIQ